MADPTVASQYDYKGAKGGSSSIQVALESDSEAADAWGVSSSHALATAGWHEISPALTGGTLGRERDVEEIRLENDVKWIETESDDNIVITDTTIVVDPLRFNILEWLEDHFVKARYFLPTRPDGGYQEKDIDSTATENIHPLGHWWLFPRLDARKVEWSMDVSNDGQRSIDLVVEASKPTDASEQEVYHQALLPLDTSATVATEADRALRNDWSETPWSNYADSAI